MNLTDVVAQYRMPKDDFSVNLPTISGEFVEVKFRRVRNAAELADLKAAGLEWAENARVHATGEAREAMGELVGDSGLACLVWAYIFAETVRDDELDVETKRHQFCIMAAFAGPVFEQVRHAFMAACLSPVVGQVTAAIEGKAPCGTTTSCESGCESPETCGADTPTN